MNQSAVTNKPRITAVLGIKGAGKDTYFKSISGSSTAATQSNYAQVMFAGALKEVAKLLFPDVDIEDRVIKETKRQFDTLEVDTIVRQWTLDFFKKMNYPISNHEPAISARFFKTYGFTDAIGEQKPTICLSPRDVSLYIGSVDWLRIHPNITDLIGKYAVKTAKELANKSNIVFFTDVRFPVEVQTISEMSYSDEYDVKYILIVRYKKTNKPNSNKIELSDKLSYTDHITEHMNNELTQLAIQAYNEHINPADVVKDKLAMLCDNKVKLQVSVVFNKEREQTDDEIGMKTETFHSAK